VPSSSYRFTPHSFARADNIVLAESISPAWHSSEDGCAANIGARIRTLGHGRDVACNVLHTQDHRIERANTCLATIEFISGSRPNCPSRSRDSIRHDLRRAGAERGLPASAAQAMSSIVFAGSAPVRGGATFRDGQRRVVICPDRVRRQPAAYALQRLGRAYVMHLDAKWKCLLAYLLPTKRTPSSSRATAGIQPIPPRRRTALVFLGAADAVEHMAGEHRRGHLAGRADSFQLGVDFTLALTFIAARQCPRLTVVRGVAAALSAGVVAVLAANLALQAGPDVRSHPRPSRLDWHWKHGQPPRTINEHGRHEYGGSPILARRHHLCDRLSLIALVAGCKCRRSSSKHCALCRPQCSAIIFLNAHTATAHSTCRPALAALAGGLAASSPGAPRMCC